MARAAILVHLPCDRCHRGIRGGEARSQSPGRGSILHDGLIFAAALGALAISFWPCMIPFSITIEEAAAPHSSLAFMFWREGIFVFAFMLLYIVIGYSVFRGKVEPTADHY
jgi:cytochrome bd-type quinol oxidase subunit 2